MEVEATFNVHIRDIPKVRLDFFAKELPKNEDTVDGT
jgi:hypothetical protein